MGEGDGIGIGCRVGDVGFGDDGEFGVVLACREAGREAEVVVAVETWGVEGSGIGELECGRIDGG